MSVGVFVQRKSIFSWASEKSKVKFFGSHTPNFTVPPLCLAFLHSGGCVGSQHVNTLRLTDRHEFIARVEMLRPAAAQKGCCSSPLVSLSIRAWATGPVHVSTHARSLSVLCWFWSGCYIGFGSELINTQSPSLPHKTQWECSSDIFLALNNAYAKTRSEADSMFSTFFETSPVTFVLCLSHTDPRISCTVFTSVLDTVIIPVFCAFPFVSHTQTHTEIQTTLGRLIACLAQGHTVIDRRGVGQQEWVRNSKWSHTLPSLLRDDIVNFAGSLANAAVGF